LPPQVLASLPPPSGPPLAPGAAGGVPRWLVALLVGVVVALLVGVAFLVGVVTGDEPSPPSSTTRPVTMPSSVAPPTSPAPTVPTTPDPTVPPTPPSSVPAPGPAVRAGTVVRTCGASGGGDCFLSVRAAPTSSSAEILRLDEGDPVSVVCQVQGASVLSSSLGRRTTVWVRDPAGRYLSAAFLDVPGWSPFTISEPCP
jgi:hypothetical protein